MTSLRSVVCIAALALVACAKDPTSGKTKAEVGAARTEVAAPAGGESLTVTAAESRVGFIGAKVTAQHEGSFKEVAGTILLVDADPVKSRVDMTVQTGSVELEPKKLENHLRSPDFFDVEKYPTARFVSTEIKKDGAGYVVTGNLELHGVTRSVTFPASIDITPTAVAVQAEFGVNRKDFGIVYPGAADDLIKDNVLLQIKLTAPRTKTGV